MNLAKLAPSAVRRPLGRLARLIQTLPYRGTGRFCPVCERPSSHFAPHGTTPRPEARCVHCGSLERHRLIWLYLKEHTDIFNGHAKSVLHVAPQPVFQRLLSERLGTGYLTADLYNPNVMVKMDITDIQYPDDSFDVIYCSHVLEHVPDDAAAMAEFRRVLKPDGWALLLVPIKGEQTQEDLSITDPDERTRRYGQADHVRQYGQDYPDRLRAAGFQVDIHTPESMYTPSQLKRLGIQDDPIYHCKKRGSTPSAS